MKQYLLDSFLFNSAANKKMLSKIKLLPDKEQCIKYFSHLINSQNKWMARILQDPNAAGMSWWEPLYDLEQLESEWDKCLSPWIEYIHSKTELELEEEIIFTGFDGSSWAVRSKDIALQLNYHSIHHRAQMQLIIREQNIEPDFIDYIGTKYRKLSAS
jgi:uncharacterized damage-inducible protein DinB